MIRPVIRPDTPDLGLTEAVVRMLRRAVVDENDCWRLPANANRNYYTQARLNGQKVASHRLSYEYFVGAIPDGHEIDHLCRVPSCVNPEHLEAVTHAENVRRGMAGAHFGRRTHCKYGHPLEGDNLYLWKRSHGYTRRCRTCRRASHQRSDARRRGQLALVEAA